jgi:hypothetical protein
MGESSERDMKITRKGTLPENILYTGECRHCHAEVECNATEITKHNLGDRYSGEFIENYVLCPTQGCGRRIILTERMESLTEKFAKLTK